jgi:nitrite reductase/ring-hydroxylating ferredoxin subunit
MESSSQIEDRTIQRYRVCGVGEIPDNGGVLADVGDREIGVFNYRGKLLAYDNRCIHQGGPICTGEILGATKVRLDDDKRVVDVELDEDEMRIVCPWHGWEYDLASGEAAHDPRLRLRRFPITVEDGIVYVDA